VAHEIKQENTDARERVLAVAERLFSESGYQMVTLRDIARELGLRHASLYYHFPQGKEELYIEVTARRMQRYRAGLEAAIADAASDDWQIRLRAAARWLLAQHGMHLGRMLQSDMPSISEEAAERLRVVILGSLLQPLETIFRAVADPAKRGRSVTLAGMFLSLIEGIDNLPSQYVEGSKEELADVVLDLLINGLHTMRETEET
jgi:TetR/AcrR family transcriptional regulator, cholesterol catabolism regulator